MQPNPLDAMLAYRARCVAVDLDFFSKLLPGGDNGILRAAALSLRSFAGSITPAPLSALVDAPASGAGVPQ